VPDRSIVAAEESKEMRMKGEGDETRIQQSWGLGVERGVKEDDEKYAR
jgi:hypothetical protein